MSASSKIRKQKLSMNESLSIGDCEDIFSARINSFFDDHSYNMCLGLKKR